MPFCKLNGIVVPVSVDDHSAEPVLIEDNERAESASLLVDRRAEKGRWSFSITPQVAAAAFAFRSLLHGRGQYWSFDTSLYSSKGLGPSLSTDVSLVGGGSTWLGAGAIVMAAPSGDQRYLALTPLSTEGWTVMTARKVGAAAWQHFIVTSAGSVYTNGVLTGSAAWLTVTTSTGEVKIVADAIDDTLHDELIVLPYVVPSDWPSQLYTFQNPAVGNTQWGALRNLKLQGDMVEEPSATKTVVGRVKSSRPIISRVTGVKTILRTIQGELEEV